MFSDDLHFKLLELKWEKRHPHKNYTTCPTREPSDDCKAMYYVCVQTESTGAVSPSLPNLFCSFPSQSMIQPALLPFSLSLSPFSLVPCIILFNSLLHAGELTQTKDD